MNERYLVRRFQPARDLEAARHCFSSGFHHILWPIIDEAEPRLVEDLILAMSGAGDCTLVAEEGGEARGILVGCFMYRLNFPRKLWSAGSFGGSLRGPALRYEHPRLQVPAAGAVGIPALPLPAPAHPLGDPAAHFPQGVPGRHRPGHDGWLDGRDEESGLPPLHGLHRLRVELGFLRALRLRAGARIPLRAYKYSMPEKYTAPEKRPTAYIYSLRW